MSSEQDSGFQAIIYRRGKSEKLEMYRNCMAGKLKGKQFPTREERLKHFAISAKLCSGRTKTTEEAIEHIKSKHPEWFK